MNWAKHPPVHSSSFAPGLCMSGCKNDQMPNELVVRLVVISLYGRVLDRPVHPFDLSVKSKDHWAWAVDVQSHAHGRHGTKRMAACLGSSYLLGLTTRRPSPRPDLILVLLVTQWPSGVAGAAIAEGLALYGHGHSCKRSLVPDAAHGPNLAPHFDEIKPTPRQFAERLEPGGENRRPGRPASRL